MRIVLGLGNPGERYRGTRHNVGFRVVDELARRCGVRLRALPLDERVAWGAEAEISGRPVLLAQPRTYMNRSGRAALLVCRAHREDPADLIVVHDDADLALGRVRIRAGGSAGGHNGIRSLLETLGTDAFVRVKLGVRGTGRPSGEDLADYVLEDFEPDERPLADSLVVLGADAVEALIAEGLGPAMNRFNGTKAAPETEA